MIVPYECMSEFNGQTIRISFTFSLEDLFFKGCPVSFILTAVMRIHPCQTKVDDGRFYTMSFVVHWVLSALRAPSSFLEGLRLFD